MIARFSETQFTYKRVFFLGRLIYVYIYCLITFLKLNMYGMNMS